MKNLRKLAGITIFLILVFMVIALFRFQDGTEDMFFPDQIALGLNDSWVMVSLEGLEPSGEEPGSFDAVQEDGREAFANGKGQEAALPYTGKCRAGQALVFRNTMQADYSGLTLRFSATGADVYVALAGEPIYQYISGEDGTAENHLGAGEHVVDLPYMLEDGELCIGLVSIGQDTEVSFGNASIETRDVVAIGIVGNSIADIGCCLLIIIMAIIMFVLALIRRYTCQPARGELFLGLTGLAAGIYCFIGTDTLSIFYNVQEAYAMQEYLVLLLPLFLTLYYERNFHMVYPRRFSVLIWGMSIHAGVQILLHMFGIRNLEDMGNVSAIAVGTVCVVAIVSLIQFDYTNRQYQTWLSVLSMLALLAGGIANVMMNTFFLDAYGNVAGQYSMAVFGIMMAVVHVLQLSKEYRASAEENARLLEEEVKLVERQNMQLIQAKKEADAAKQEALAANDAKGKFLAHMSHEIRTPINAVLGMDEMILRETKERQIREYAMDINMAGQTLLSLINDILDFSKIESGKMEIVPVEYDISSLIHDLVNMASQRAKDKNLRFEVEVAHDIPSRLYGDDVRLRQILTNILTNAVKYTHEGGVWLRVMGRQKEGEELLRFEVEDTGIGIKEEDLPKLSAEFERIEEDRNRNIEGTGLGMSITIQLLELLGSRLHVESAYGKGSKFYFELGKKIMDETPVGNFEARVRRMAQDYHYTAKLYAPEAKILVVDDNAMNRKVLRNLLKGTQIQVTEAESGEQCLEFVQENRYDLIFLDHMMPGMDGVEALHRIKELSGHPCQDTPIVALTANAVSGAKEKYLSEGFDDFLSKPVAPEKLERMIQKMLPEELQQPEHGNCALQPPETELCGTGRQGTENAQEDFLEGLPMVDGLDWQYAWLHLPDAELLEFTLKEFYAQIASAADKLEQAYWQTAEYGQEQRNGVLAGGLADALAEGNGQTGEGAAKDQAKEQEALAQYRIQVHAMKSLAATVGIVPLAGAAKILEYAAKDGRIDVVRSITGVFLEEWRGYHKKLQGVFGMGEESGKGVADYSVIKALVEMVRISMQEMDIDQADEAVGQLRAYNYPEGMESNMQKLAEAVTNLDAEEAERIAGLLNGQMAGL